MKSLIYFEIKKMLQKKSTWASFGVLMVLQIFVSISGNLGSTYVEDEFVETHMEQNQKNKENGVKLSGRVIDQKLIKEMQDAYASVDISDNRMYMLSEEYQSKARVYSQLHYKISGWIAGLESVDISSMDADTLYHIRNEGQKALYKSYGLSKNEIAYWKKQEEQLSKPFTYQYATAYEYLMEMGGGYMSLMLLTFFIAITMGSVFMDEYTRKTDQIVKCMRNGRGKLYFAKIITGSIITFTVSLLFIIVSVIGNFICYGQEGFGASIQVAIAFLSSYHLTMGQVFLIISGIVLLSSVFIGCFTMFLAEILHSSIGAVAIIIGGLFAVRIIVVPSSWRAVSQIWNLVPINLVKVDQGFLDLRLFSLGGLQLTTWQIAPIIYLLIGGLIIVTGKVCFCTNKN